MDKNTLRKTILRQSREMSAESRLFNSQKIWDSHDLSKYLKQAKTVLFFWSLPDEVITHQKVAEMSVTKNILLPTIVQNHLLLKPFSGIETMIPDARYGILEPTGEEFVDFDSIDVVIVPGVAFDLQCHRLGRGKGFYDRFLPKIPDAIKIGVCFDHQVVEVLPSEPHDILMDLVITPTFTIKRQRIKNCRV